MPLSWTPITDGSTSDRILLDGFIPNGMLLEIGPPLTETYYKWIHLEWNPSECGSTFDRIRSEMDPPLMES